MTIFVARQIHEHVKRRSAAAPIGWSLFRNGEELFSDEILHNPEISRRPIQYFSGEKGWRTRAFTYTCRRRSLLERDEKVAY